MDNRIRKIGIVMLCSYCVMGMLIVLSIGIAFLMRTSIGSTNAVVDWLLKSVAINSNVFRFEDEDTLIGKYKVAVRDTESIIENFCTTSFLYNQSISETMIGIKESVLFIRDDDIKYYSSETPEEVGYAKLCIDEVNEMAKDAGASFTYIQAPSRLRYELLFDKEAAAKETMSEKVIECADILTNQLLDSGINTLSLSEEIEMEKLVFDYTSHWSCENALEATAVIANYLNTHCKITIDETAYKRDQYKDVLEKMMYSGELEYNYSLPVPQREKENYTIIFNEQYEKTGSFERTLLSDKEGWTDEANINGPYHNLWLQNNSCILRIHNSGDGLGEKKLLILGDSFSWPVVAYLSQSYGDVVAINPRYYGGNVKQFVLKECPDDVLMIYFEGQLGGSDYKEAFGFMELSDE